MITSTHLEDSVNGISFTKFTHRHLPSLLAVLLDDLLFLLDKTLIQFYHFTTKRKEVDKEIRKDR